MRKCDEIANPNSCLNKARADEWIFVLLGRDESAIVAVRAWIEHRVQSGKNKRDDVKIMSAENWIKEVEAEQKISKLPC
jgi:hypothetical protein